MGQIKIKTKDGQTGTAVGRFFVDAKGEFLGEYFLDDKGRPLPGCMPLPSGAVEVTSQPASARHVWNSKNNAWSDPGPSANELQREADEQARKARKTDAIAKLEGMGLTVDDIKAALS